MAGLAQGQPIEVRGFGVTGPGLAGPPYLANPHMKSDLELTPENLDLAGCPKSSPQLKLILKSKTEMVLTICCRRFFIQKVLSIVLDFATT